VKWSEEKITEEKRKRKITLPVLKVLGHKMLSIFKKNRIQLKFAFLKKVKLKL